MPGSELVQLTALKTFLILVLALQEKKGWPAKPGITQGPMKDLCTIIDPNLTEIEN